MIFITDTATEALLVRALCAVVGAAVAAACICRMARLDKAHHRPAYIALHAAMGLWAGGRTLQALAAAGMGALDLHDLLGLTAAALYIYITYPLWSGTAVPPLALRTPPGAPDASAQVLAMVRTELERTRSHLVPIQGAAQDVASDVRRAETTDERQQP